MVTEVLTAEGTSTSPNATDSAADAFRPVGSHGSLDDLQRLSSSVSVFPANDVSVGIAYLSQSCYSVGLS